MDPVTQAALGAACSQSILYKYDKRNAWMVGALSGMAADLDVFIRASEDPMFTLIYHRHFTHSLIFIPVGALLVALALFLFKRFRVRWRLTLLASFIGYGTHALLDACTTYGTLLYWPFSDHRVAWDMISIIDPLFTLPLIGGILWTQLLDDRRGVIIGLALAALFLIFNSYQHQRAVTAAENYAKTHAWELVRLRAFPELLSSTHWRVAAFKEGKLFLAEVLTPLFSASVVKKPLFFKKFKQSDLPDFVYHSGRQLRDFTVFSWFSDGYLIAVKQNPLVIVDARYLKDEPLESLKAFWGIQFHPGDNHIRTVRNIKIPAQVEERP